ncbi:MAG: hypothetical protein LBF86_08585 [Helicobacteraceae bacterium]|jgi:hypothetical protein|nr:hypothetical protein [Helicobacteraceae bacterium]
MSAVIGNRVFNDGSYVDIVLSRGFNRLEKAVLIALDDTIKPNKTYDEEAYKSGSLDFKRISTHRLNLTKLYEAIKQNNAFKDIDKREIEIVAMELNRGVSLWFYHKDGEWRFTSRLNLISLRGGDSSDKNEIYLSFFENNLDWIKHILGTDRVGKAIANLGTKKGWN